MRKLLFFHASCCPPCRFYEKQFIIPLEKQMDLKEKIQRIDAQRNPFVAEKYMVDKLPMIILLDGSTVYRRCTGGMNIEQTAKWLNDEDR